MMNRRTLTKLIAALPFSSVVSLVGTDIQAADIDHQNPPLLEQAIGSHVELHLRGNHKVGRCPFHQEQTPSFVVYDEAFHCYGCKREGDVFDWLSALRTELPATGYDYLSTCQYLLGYVRHTPTAEGFYEAGNLVTQVYNNQKEATKLWRKAHKLGWCKTPPKSK